MVPAKLCDAKKNIYSYRIQSKSCYAKQMNYKHTHTHKHELIFHTSSITKNCN